MLQKLSKNWLLALAGILQAMFAVVNLLMQDPDAVVLRKLAVENTTLFQAKLALAAGACTIAAALWNSRKGKRWLLAANGLAFIAYGLIPVLWTGPLGFRLFALLIVVMAMTMAVFELATARTLRRHAVDEWFLGVAGAASVGFALAFLALGFHWIKLEAGPQSSVFLWLGSYFGFSAICMMGMALRLNGRPADMDGMPGSALVTG